MDKSGNVARKSLFSATYYPRPWQRLPRACPHREGDLWGILPVLDDARSRLPGGNVRLGLTTPRGTVPPALVRVASAVSRLPWASCPKTSYTSHPGEQHLFAIFLIIRIPLKSFMYLRRGTDYMTSLRVHPRMSHTTFVTIPNDNPLISL
jgi:hypothetical protein